MDSDLSEVFDTATLIRPTALTASGAIAWTARKQH